MEENETDKNKLKEFEELRDEALELKDKLGLPSIDTAFLMLIRQDLDTIKFHNSD